MTKPNVGVVTPDMACGPSIATEGDGYDVDVGFRGEMWRREGEYAETVPLEVGVCVTVPLGTAFQFKSDGPDALTAVAITMPPWPGEGEAYEVDGAWQPRVHNA